MTYFTPDVVKCIRLGECNSLFLREEATFLITRKSCKKVIWSPRLNRRFERTFHPKIWARAAAGFVSPSGIYFWAQAWNGQATGSPEDILKVRHGNSYALPSLRSHRDPKHLSIEELGSKSRFQGQWTLSW